MKNKKTVDAGTIQRLHDIVDSLASPSVVDVEMVRRLHAVARRRCPFALSEIERRQKAPSYNAVTSWRQRTTLWSVYDIPLIAVLMIFCPSVVDL